MTQHSTTFLKMIARMFPNIETDYLDSIYDVLNKLPEPIVITIDKGENIYNKGDRVKDIFFLMDGLVRVYDISDDNNNHDINLRLLCDDSVVMPVYSITKNWQITNISQTKIIASETAEAITVCKGFKIPLSTLDEIEGWGDKFKLELTIRHYRSMEERLRMLQLKTASQRYEIFKHCAPEKIVKLMPNLHVASYLGISPETLSRIKQKF